MTDHSSGKKKLYNLTVQMVDSTNRIGSWWNNMRYKCSTSQLKVSTWIVQAIFTGRTYSFPNPEYESLHLTHKLLHYSSQSCHFFIVNPFLLIGKHYIVQNISLWYSLVLLPVYSYKCFTLGMCNIYYYRKVKVIKAKTGIIFAI